MPRNLSPKRPAVLALTFAISILSISGEGTAAEKAAPEALPPSLYATLPPGKTPREVTRFSVIDDFNSRQSRNRFGAPWEREFPLRGRFEFKFVKEDLFRGRHGGSLRLKAFLPLGMSGTVRSSLEGRDMSQAEALIFACRIEEEQGKPFLGKLQLTLTDLKGRSETHDLTPTCTSGDPAEKSWREAVLARRDLALMDWSRLGRIAFTVTAATGPVRARIGIDELAFFGKDDLEFVSKRDNLIGFPRGGQFQERVTELLAEPDSKEFLYEIARDTWKYFENAVDRNTHLPVDHVRVGPPSDVGSYTTPTNLAMYFLACIGARELGLISKKEALQRIRGAMGTLRLMRRWRGFHYNYYDTGNLKVTRRYVSAVDSGWLAAAWAVIRQAFPKELRGLATQFLNEADFYEFYDPAIGQLRLGYDVVKHEPSPYHYGLIATEARVASLVGIGKGNLPREHWWFLYRTPPAQWDWQSQKPQGREVEIERVTFFEGYYTYQGRKFVPSWGGSMFEFLMPGIILKERELAPKGLGLNNRVATEIQIDYALNRQGYPVWGISPASTASGRLWRYSEYGVKYLGVKGYRDEGIVTPYASFMALETLPEQAIDNLRRMLQVYEAYGEYGFYDSINVRTGRVNAQYLALDQGMILAAITNYLREGALQKYFHSDEIGKSGESLLGAEEFFV